MHFQRRQLLRTLSFVFGSSFFLSRRGIAAQTGTQATTSSPGAGEGAGKGVAGAEMEKVTGIGGFFFRAKDPKALASWYNEHLGVSPVPTGAGQEPWEQQAGTTA